MCSSSAPASRSGAPCLERAHRSRPAVIVQCSGVADVLEALRFARDHDLLVAVRGGGHDVAGLRYLTAASSSISRRSEAFSRDPAKRTVRAQAGVTSGRPRSRESGVRPRRPGRSCIDDRYRRVHITVVARGGFHRTYGMTCDSLLSADVITSAGEFVSASDTERADLFWALRGGGGNFGIVTDFEYRLRAVHPVLVDTRRCHVSGRGGSRRVARFP